MTKGLKIIRNGIISLEDEYQHYTMVEKDVVKAKWIKDDIADLKVVEKELNNYEKLKSIIENKYNEIEKKLNARVDYDYELHLSQKQFLEELKEVIENE